ncbi:MAG: A/G-specific adenine glycosylase [Planctomycetaceae bacterium]|nr:A/G-specific adenine glycosylase [Planctomycetaceae bacterium]
MKDVTLFRRRLLDWYAVNARTLSWRGAGDPYLVWVSEIMLQQTTTQTVEGYFNRFITAFPTIQSLAAAELDSVNRLWEGLGYYRRCSQLHQAAKIIVNQYGGVFPRNEDTVRKLPGIGRYTANAVLSIAFDRQLPILEANTQRLYARLTALRSDPAEKKANDALWHFAESLLPKTGSGRFNQALMDLGSLVCTAKNPLCLSDAVLFGRGSVCPAAGFCQAAKLGLQKDIPLQKIRERAAECSELAVLINRRSRTLLVRYPQGVRWAGLWDFPRTAFEAADTVGKKLAAMTGYHILLGEDITVLKHSVTKYRITLHFCRGVITGHKNAAQYETRWATADEMQTLPMNSTARKLVRLISG